MKKSTFAVLLFGALLSCTQNTGEQASETPTSTEQPAENKPKDFTKAGGDIVAAMHSHLLSNLENAIAAGGVVSAIQYCNIRASQLTDSLSNVYNCQIARISARARNPENRLTALDAPALQAVSTDSLPPFLLVETDSSAIYYQKISLASPTCLKCHGRPGKEIEAGTLTAIKQLYPKDIAVGYALNDTRGAWKITFKK